MRDSLFQARRTREAVSFLELAGRIKMRCPVSAMILPVTPRVATHALANISCCRSCGSRGVKRLVAGGAFVCRPESSSHRLVMLSDERATTVQSRRLLVEAARKGRGAHLARFGGEPLCGGEPRRTPRLYRTYSVHRDQ